MIPLQNKFDERFQMVFLIRKKKNAKAQDYFGADARGSSNLLFETLQCSKG